MTHHCGLLGLAYLTLATTCLGTAARLFDDGAAAGSLEDNRGNLRDSGSKTQAQDSPIYSMSWDDFSHTYLMENIVGSCRYSSADYKQIGDLPNLLFEVNWEDFGAVGKIRDQAACKSPWAFAAVSAIEAHAFIQSGELYRAFSVQQVLDCMGKNNRMDCGTGSSGKAFNYLQKQGGIAVDMLYSNKSMLKKNIDAYSVCKFGSTGSGMQVNGGSKDIKPFDELTLISSLLNIGPIAVMMDGRGLKNYQGGIWNGSYTDSQGNPAMCSSDSSQLNHAALIVGVEKDTESGVEYYSMLNSWGPGWGEKGFFRLERSLNACGISICAAYPRLQPF